MGLQTDQPLKRAIMPAGGVNMIRSALDSRGYSVDPEIELIFMHYRKTHNLGVFDAYTPEIRAARSAGIITGLPDAYGRGRIIVDYRRVALYGIDFLIEDKKRQLQHLDTDQMLEETIRQREELSEQIRSLLELAEMADAYGFDIRKPARNAREAVQYTYCLPGSH